MFLQSRWSNCRGRISRRNSTISIWFTEHWVNSFLILGEKSLKRQGVIIIRRSLETRGISHKPIGDHKVSPVFRSAPGRQMPCASYCRFLFCSFLPDQNGLCGKTAFSEEVMCASFESVIRSTALVLRTAKAREVNWFHSDCRVNVDSEWHLQGWWKFYETETVDKRKS